MRKKTNDEFVKEFHAIANGEYDLLDEYAGSSAKIRILHKSCGTIYETTPHIWLSGHKCPKCSEKMKMRKFNEWNAKNMNSPESIRRDARRILGEDYIVEDYRDNKVFMKHIRCGYEYSTSLAHLKEGHMCPKCRGVLRMTTLEFKKYINESGNGDYALKSEYINNKKNVIIRHISCGHEFSISPGNWKKGQRCPKCSRKKQYEKARMDHSDFEKIFYDSIDDDDKYTLLSKYIKYSEKMKVRHEKCGTVFEVLPTNWFYNENRCPICKRESSGEKSIRSFLDNHNISFISQYRIDGCRDKICLPFDFAVFYGNNKSNPMMLIEYDGEQHYAPIYGDDSFNLMNLHDGIKSSYAKDNNIILLRIPYWEKDNIEKILDDALIKNPLLLECKKE